MLHTLHYDVAYYAPGCKRHPGALKDRSAFLPLTLLGLEKLQRAPAGEWDGKVLYTIKDDDGEAVMDYLAGTEVHLDH